jgi:hypothetical protein
MVRDSCILDDVSIEARPPDPQTMHNGTNSNPAMCTLHASILVTCIIVPTSGRQSRREAKAPGEMQ